ncbi:MAG: hypothetical protein HLUCCA11_15495 [Phormidesmis priestleyi Ana]|uniref:Uncharacterized protein n=1 Tax=Phormidesmis priestleyi Ana TaxID=1666911 RepID=A0A0N8KMP6_9CYAN|nr:MAG: hypothetical protein HLUCCA11_15495 [Phormidesmis priestleyi Ana]
MDRVNIGSLEIGADADNKANVACVGQWSAFVFTGKGAVIANFFENPNAVAQVENGRGVDFDVFAQAHGEGGEWGVGDGEWGVGKKRRKEGGERKKEKGRGSGGSKRFVLLPRGVSG